MEKKKNSSKQQSFLEGSFILLLATAVVKILGALYRIPLTALIGDDGMGFYSTAYDLYLPMYSIAMAGLPIAISRMVAEYVSTAQYNSAVATLKVARRAFWVTGGTGFVLMSLLAYPYVLYADNELSFRGILCIAPCLLFCCIMSAYRGYYQGLRNMTPTALSEVIEALGKLIFGYGFAFVAIKLSGDYSAQTLSNAAAAALFGITLGTAASSAFLVLKYKFSQPVFTAAQLEGSPMAEDNKVILKKMIAIALPIVAGSLVNNVTSLIDVAMVQHQLNVAIEKAPEVFNNMYSELIASKLAIDPEYNIFENLANTLYGCHRGFAYSIYNLVPVLTSVLGVSAIPVLVTAWSKKDGSEIKNNIETMLRTTAIICMPIGVGVATLSWPILNLLYSHQPLSIAVASKNLTILGVCAIFSGLAAPMTNMLQAIGKQKIPLRNIAIGAVLKIIINFVLVSTPSINIVGVPIGTLICYITIALLNLLSLVKHTKIVPNFFSCFVKPLISAIFCGVAAYFSYNLLVEMLGAKIAVIVGIAVAGVVYFVVLMLLKTLNKYDVLSMPKGNKIYNILCKVGYFR